MGVKRGPPLWGCSGGPDGNAHVEGGWGSHHPAGPTVPQAVQGAELGKGSEEEQQAAFQV